MENLQPFIIDIVKNYAVNALWIIALFFLGRIVLKKIVGKAVKLADYIDRGSEQRTKTLGNIIISTGNVVIYVVILLMILTLFGVDITPIIAGAGIIGLAIGFGSQSLVKDFVSGLFILIENQYTIGDKVKIGNFEGRVVKMTMRSTVLQDDDGKVFHLSNGSINNVANLSQCTAKSKENV